MAPSATAASSHAVAAFSAARIELEGDLLYQDSFLYAFSFGQGPGNFTWHLKAENITVNVTRQEWIEATRPTSPSQALGSVATGPKQSSTHYFSAASANSSSTSKNSFMWSPIGPATSSWMAATSATVAFTASPPPEAQEVIERHGAESPIPPNSTWATGKDGKVGVAGVFSLRLWDMNITVRNESKVATFRSGNWTDPVNPGTQNQIRKRYEQTVSLALKNATLETASLGRSFVTATARTIIEGNVTAKFSDVQGFTRYQARDTPLSQELVFAGPARLHTWNPIANGSKLENELFAAPELLGLLPGPQPDTPQISVAKPKAFSLPVTLALTPLALAGFGIFLVALRRSRPPEVDDVEWALFEKRPADATRLARRLVRRNPQDATAVFLLATALLARDKDAELVRAVEPLALKLKVKDRAGVAYVLARAAHQLKDNDRTRTWATEAAKQPALRTQLVRDGILHKGWPEFMQSGYA